jgi:putative endonuclease
MARHNEIGQIGEDIAEKFLRGKGFEIVERNYRKPYGEIDIVARLPGQGERGGKLHFVEVKTVSHGTYRPEEHLHPWKLKRLSRVFQVYLVSHPPDRRAGGTPDWQFDVLCVYLNQDKKTARVKEIPNIVIGT